MRFLSLALLLSAPAPAFAGALEQLVHEAPAPAVVPSVPQPAPTACLFDARTGLPVPALEAFARAARSQVVYAGEAHDNPRHHAAQGQLLDLLAAADPRAAAGFEMLYATQQAALERYLKGGSTEEQFLAEVDWPNTWSMDYALYRALFDRLRVGSRDGAALNVPRPIVRKISREGLASLNEEERAFIPAGFRRAEDAAYLAMLRETYARHGRDPNDPVGFGNYVDAMSVWNEAMAASLVDFVRTRSGAPVLVIAGAFHAYTAGIPQAVGRRLPGATQTSFILEDADECPPSLPAAELSLDADYIWLTVP